MRTDLWDNNSLAQWSLVDPVLAADDPGTEPVVTPVTVVEGAGTVTFNLPAGNYDEGTTVRNAPKYLQPFTGGDFDIAVRVDTEIPATTATGTRGAGLCYFNADRSRGVLLYTYDSTTGGVNQRVLVANITSLTGRTNLFNASPTSPVLGSPPTHLRLVKAGTTHTAYVSLDGTTWTQVYTGTISTFTPTHIGVFALSGSNANALTMGPFQIAGDPTGNDGTPPPAPTPWSEWRNGAATPIYLEGYWDGAVVRAITGSSENVYVAPAAPTQPSTVSFPLGVASDQRHLEDTAGSPFYYVADTPWLAMNRLDQAGIDTLIANRVSKGFTTLQLSVLGHQSEGSIANTYGKMPFGGTANSDLTQPLTDAGYDYWDHIEWIVDRCAAAGLLCALVPAWHGYTGRDWRGYITTANAASYGTFLASRLGNRPNVMWIMGGDNNPTTNDATGVPAGLDATDKTAATNLMANAIKAGSSVEPLMTYHTKRTAEAYDYFGTQPWFDISTAYSRQTTYPFVLTEYNRSDVKPVVLIESHYDSRNSTPILTDQELRAEAWWAFLAGAAGFSYGDWNLWRIANFPSSMNRPSASHMKHLSNAIYTHGRNSLRPDDRSGNTTKMLTGGLGTSGGEDYAVSAVSASGDRGLAYFPSSRTGIVVNLAAFTGGNVALSWLDPATGLSTAIGSYPASGTQAVTYPAGAADRVLVASVVITTPNPQPTTPTPDPAPDAGNLPLVMLSLSDGAANRTALTNASATYPAFAWDAPGTVNDVVPLTGSFTVDNTCGRIVARSPQRRIQQQTDDTWSLIRRGTGTTSTPCGAMVKGTNRVPGLATGHGLTVNSWVFLNSTNPIKANGKQNVGYLAKVTAVATNHVDVDLTFPATMDSQPQYARLTMAPALEIDGGVWEHKNAVSQYFRDIMYFAAAVAPRVTAATTIQRGVMGIGLLLTSDAHISARIRWLIDDQNGDGYNDPETGARMPNPGGSDNPLFGYAVPIYGANRKVKIDGIISHCRHALTTNAPSGNHKVPGLAFHVDSGDTPEIDYSARTFLTSATPGSTHEAIGDTWVHDCDISDGGTYWALHGSIIGAENPDFLNMRGNTRVERVRMYMRDIPGEHNAGVVLQDLFHPSLTRPRMEINNSIISGGKGGVVTTVGSVTGFTFPGGSIDLQDVTIEMGSGGYALWAKYGSITGNNVVIRALPGATGIFAMCANAGGTINITNLRIEGFTKYVYNNGGTINYTVDPNATGSSLSLPAAA